MIPIVKFIAVSAVSLCVVETVLSVTGQPMYTSLYQDVRKSKAGFVPLVLTVGCILHLEDKIPHRYDPFYVTMRVLRATKGKIL